MSYFILFSVFALMFGVAMYLSGPTKCNKCGGDCWYWGNDRYFCEECGEEQE